MAAESRREVGMRFILGGSASAMAFFCVHPVDTMKIRLQLDNELSGRLNLFENRYYKGVVRGAFRVCKEEGIVALYRGVSASMMRELTYSSIRAGSYEPIKVMLGGTDRHNTAPSVKLLAGALAGLLGSSFTTPTDIVKVRLQADGINNKPKVYRGLTHCFMHVYKTQGFSGLYTGATPNMIRAVCATSTQFPVYDHTKHTLLKYKLLEEGYLLHFTSAMVAGLISAIAINPSDVVKTRIMNQKASETKYRGPLDTFIKTIKSEGPLGLFKGTIASYMRLGPGIMLNFMIYEQLRKLFNVAPM